MLGIVIRWSLVLLMACYNPAADPPCAIRCSPSLACPSNLTCDMTTMLCSGDQPCGTAGGDASSSDGDPTDAPPDGTPIDALAACPAGYASIPATNTESKYRLVASATPWLMAAEDCANDAEISSPLQTHLVVFSSVDERLAIASTVAGADVWIGLSDRKTVDTHRWVTMEATPEPPAPPAGWAAGEPSRGPLDECTMINRTDLLETDDCGRTFAFYCECDMFPNLPSQYTP